jgi:hypothetical protein
MHLWVVWNERNNILWNGGAFKPLIMSAWAIHHLEEYHKFHPLNIKLKKRRVSKWSCPPWGRLKINVDGVFTFDKGHSGIGVVVQNDEGVCIAALARHFPHAISAQHMEE